MLRWLMPQACRMIRATLALCLVPFTFASTTPQRPPSSRPCRRPERLRSSSHGLARGRCAGEPAGTVKRCASSPPTRPIARRCASSESSWQNWHPPLGLSDGPRRGLPAPVPRGTRGHEQRGARYAVIVQADEFLDLSTVLIAPTSTSARRTVSARDHPRPAGDTRPCRADDGRRPAAPRPISRTPRCKRAACRRRRPHARPRPVNGHAEVLRQETLAERRADRARAGGSWPGIKLRSCRLEASVSDIRTGSTRVTAESPRRAALDNVPKSIAAVATSAEYKKSCQPFASCRIAAPSSAG